MSFGVVARDALAMLALPESRVHCLILQKSIGVKYFPYISLLVIKFPRLVNDFP